MIVSSLEYDSERMITNVRVSKVHCRDNRVDRNHALTIVLGRERVVWPYGETGEERSQRKDD